MKNWKLSDWMRVCVIALAVLALALTLYALYRPEAASLDAESAWSESGLGRTNAPESERGRI